MEMSILEKLPIALQDCGMEKEEPKLIPGKNMDNKKLEQSIDKLWHDYLDLCDSYRDEMPVYEFGFAMIRFVSQMLFDCAPSEEVARKTIMAGIDEGLKDSKKEK